MKNFFNIDPLEKIQTYISKFKKEDPFNYGFYEYEMMQFYKKNFTESIYKFTTPLYIQKNTFYIGVTSAQIAYEMQFSSQEILNKIRNNFKMSKLEKINYKIIEDI